MGKEKPKNDQAQRPFQWRLLAMGLVLVVIATVIILQAATRNEGAGSGDINVEGAELTATTIIRQATQTAQAALNNTGGITPATALDSIEMTATSIIQTATTQANSS